MKFNDEFKSQENNTGRKASNIFFSHNNTVIIYIVLSILLKMKTQLGLEAMLIYIGRYQTIIEKHNPRLKLAVNQALSMMNVEKIYNDATYGEDK